MKNKSFEEAMKELESVVGELEGENLSLEESVKKFQNGIELSNYCNKLLEDAEKKITILIENSNGEITEQNFTVEKEESSNDGDME